MKDIKIAEYKTLRNEISQRLGFQQQLINFTLIVAGLFPPLVVFSNNIPEEEARLALYLLGAVISLVLAFVALKQHVFIAQLSEYISQKIIVDNESIFAGWEKYHLEKKIRSRKIPFSFLMGCCEIGFPGIISAMYLAGFWFARKDTFLPAWFMCSIFGITVVLWVILIITGIIINTWITAKE